MTRYRRQYLCLTKSSIPLSGKFWVEGLETGDRCDVNMHIIRYADAILMYAEAINEVGKSTKALAMLNRIRERAFGDDSGNFKPMSKDEFRTAILNERRLEFPHEGHRWFDLVRTGTFIQRMKEHSAYEAKVAEANKTEIAQNIKEHMILMPIPQSIKKITILGSLSRACIITGVTVATPVINNNFLISRILY